MAKTTQSITNFKELQILPEYEVKVRQCEHEYPDEGGGGAPEHGGKGVLKGEVDATVLVADACEKTLKEKTIET
jgi:hypothetical protein